MENAEKMDELIARFQERVPGITKEELAAAVEATKVFDFESVVATMITKKKKEEAIPEKHRMPSTLDYLVNLILPPLTKSGIGGNMALDLKIKMALKFLSNHPDAVARILSEGIKKNPEDFSKKTTDFLEDASEYFSKKTSKESSTEE